MEQKELWVKLSGSINYYIKDLWKENLLKSNEELLQEFISYSLEGEKPQSYQYLNKKTHEYITLDNEIVERVKSAFLERIEKKKVKYADEVQELKLKLESHADNVVDFSKYKR
jgi:serine phosphatase RsbU (regulator of sigma subunit)